MREAAIVLTLMAACGCAATGRSRSQGATGTAEQILEEVGAAQAQLMKTVGSLGTLVERPQGDVGDLYDAYAGELASLDSRVQDVRDRATDLAARREEYMKHWLAQTSAIQSPELRARAERRRTELAHEFQTLGGKAAAAKRAFAPLQASLQDCKRYLEADPTPAAARSLAPELDRIRQMQTEVQVQVDDYKSALKEILKKMSTQAPGAAPK